MAALAGLLVAAIACALGGCYSPDYAVAACTVRCSSSGDCPADLTCLPDGFCHRSSAASLCECAPLRCAEVPGLCGTVDDGCGGTVDCGGCESPLTCGGGGMANVCGDPAECEPEPCAPGACGQLVDSCGDLVDCGGCAEGSCVDNLCVDDPCVPSCVSGELACGDDGCGGSCGSCPDSRWTCHPAGVCCIRSGQQCQPLTEGCNCCPGLFCLNGSCQPAAGCALAPSLGEIPDAPEGHDQLAPR